VTWIGATKISAYTEYVCGKKLFFPLTTPEQHAWQLHKKWGGKLDNFKYCQRTETLLLTSILLPNGTPRKDSAKTFKKSKCGYDIQLQ
jgi:hypothetical protein